MRLRRLHLLNFRQHAESHVEFRPGLTGIVGPNGAGKSTILEAIGWALYGSAAARGTNETLRFARAPGRSRVQVDLEFELSGHAYRVVRGLHQAEVFLDGGDAPVATTLGGVSEYLRGRLGMSREEFFNTYFTGQKELQFLAQLGPSQRGRFLGQVLGYERLRLAQELARSRRNELRHEMDGLRAGLPDPAALLAERRSAQQRRATTAEEVVQAERSHAEVHGALAAIQPRWEEAQERREALRETEFGLQTARAEYEAGQREIRRVEAELAAIASAEAELAGLREQLRELPGVSDHCERMSKLAQRAERRRLLKDNEIELAPEVAEGADRLAKLEQAPQLAEQFAGELEEARAELDEAQRRAQELQEKWAEDRQDVKTKLEAYRERAEQLKEQLRQLREAGPEGTCPTCERPLREEFDRVVASLEDELMTLRQDGKWLLQRHEQLQRQPEDLEEAQERRTAAQRRLEETGKKLARCERAVQELSTIREEHARRVERLAQTRTDLAELPEDYDQAQHRRMEARLGELREVERLAARREQTVEARPVRERELQEARLRCDVQTRKLGELGERLKTLTGQGPDFETVRQEYERAAEALRANELRLTDARARLRSADELLEAAQRAEAAYHQKRAALHELESQHRLHNELDSAFSQLRAELNGRVRPELSELASGFLGEITDGRYTALEIDENYNILVLDEGEEKPVISGGEEDVANLVLRLAISQMIAERAGHPLSVLILDEVFGSLDVERRDNVVQLLHRLLDRFEQVILITHIETIREGLDQILRVRYDERTGSSVVEEETYEAPAPELVS